MLTWALLHGLHSIRLQTGGRLSGTPGHSRMLSCPKRMALSMGSSHALLRSSQQGTAA